MVKQSADCSDVRNTSTTSKIERISLAMQWSAPKSKWTAKRKSLLCLFSKFRKPGASAVSASLRLKLPRAILKLSLAVSSSVSTKGSSSSTFQRTVKFFSIFKTRKVCFRLTWCFRKLKEKMFSRAGCDPSRGVSRKDRVGSAPPWRLVELDHVEQQKVAVDKSLSELAMWFCRRRSCWQGQLTGLLELMGSLPLLSHFASEKERWATVVQAGVVLLSLILPYRLLSAGAVSRAAFIANCWILVLNFFNDDNKLSTALRKLWGKLVNFISRINFFTPVQVMWSTVEPFIQSGMFSGLLFRTSALSRAMFDFHRSFYRE